MTRTRFTLDDLGGGLSARALLAFLRHLPSESASVGAVGGQDGWSRTDMLLARLCEGVEELLWVTVAKGQPRSRWPRRPERIQRPGVEPEGRHIGKDPIPISEFDKWYGGK